MTQRDDDPDVQPAEDILEAFNAEEVVEQPGEPPREEDDPADDADAPAP